MNKRQIPVFDVLCFQTNVAKRPKYLDTRHVDDIKARIIETLKKVIYF